ncbi:EpsG family protein [Xenorhabdus sp. XENO-7]|uniref:EpsG family protein n=1 Tax=Xenorhabdus aichiensis TaxID=3025874 RepID=A0ABT5LY64_9GAMM|nr:EpsG family protein [Xenorhabdus aichiensis]MDC9620349.1 EpsG family protein [Xenorhabdus aichiensis]
MISEYNSTFLLGLSLISLLITIFTASLKNKAFSNSVALFLVIIYVILFGLRDYSVGSDTKAYVENFLYKNWDFELLFTAITYLIKLFTDNPTIYLMILSIIYGINIYLAYIIFGKNIKCYIVIFIWAVLFSQGMLTGTINYFRQALGFSFFLLGLGFYFKKGKIDLCSCILIISSIFVHNSNAILLSLLFLSRCINLKVIFIIYIVSLSLFFGDIGQTIINKYGDYYIVQRTLERHLYFNDRRAISTIYAHILLYSLHFFIFLYFLKRQIKNKSYKNLLKLYGLILSFSIFLSFNREMAIRYYIILQYMIPIFYMYISTCIKQKLAFSILFASYTMLYLYYLLNRPWFTDQFLGNITP